MRNTSARTALIIAGFIVSLAAGACGDKPSEADCNKLAENYVKQMSAGQEGPAADITREVAEGMRLDLIKLCMERGKQSEVDCAIKAATMEELQKCGDASTR
jgi:small lipoprotein (TIGR04454 family)